MMLKISLVKEVVINVRSFKTILCILQMRLSWVCIKCDIILVFHVGCLKLIEVNGLRYWTI